MVIELLIFWSGSVTMISNEPLSEGSAPSTSRTMIDVFFDQVGNTLSTVSSLGRILQTEDKPVASMEILNVSIDVALFSIFKVTLPESPPMSTTWVVSADKSMLGCALAWNAKGDMLANNNTRTKATARTGRDDIRPSQATRAYHLSESALRAVARGSRLVAKRSNTFLLDSLPRERSVFTWSSTKVTARSGD